MLITALYMGSLHSFLRLQPLEALLAEAVSVSEVLAPQVMVVVVVMVMGCMVEAGEVLAAILAMVLEDRPVRSLAREAAYWGKGHQGLMALVDMATFLVGAVGTHKVQGTVAQSE